MLRDSKTSAEISHQVIDIAILEALYHLGPMPQKSVARKILKSRGIQWGPYARTSDDNMKSVAVSDDVLPLTGKHAVHVTRAAEALKDKAVFSQGTRVSGAPGFNGSLPVPGRLRYRSCRYWRKASRPASILLRPNPIRNLSPGVSSSSDL